MGFPSSWPPAARRSARRSAFRLGEPPLPLGLDGAVAIGSPTVDNPCTQDYTPNAPLAGVLVIGETHSTIDAEAVMDRVAGVTYDGLALTEVPLSPFIHSAGATGTRGVLYGYFRGTGLPGDTSTREVSIDLGSDGVGAFAGIIYGLNAPGDLAVEDTSGVTLLSQANPSVDLTTAVEALLFGVILSGVTTAPAISPGANYAHGRELVLGGSPATVTSMVGNIGGPEAPGTWPVDWVAAAASAGILAVAIREV